MNCDKCLKKSVIYIRYSGAHLCKEHFIDFVEKRVMKQMSKEGRLPKGSIIAVAVSGGKDSLSALSILDKIYRKNPSINIEAVTIDEGISNYRDESIRFARDFAKNLCVPHHIVSFKEISGKTLDDIYNDSKKGDSRDSLVSECTPCGVMRRFALNKKAREIGASKLATGHNLDDIVQTIIMNIFKGDVNRLTRIGPHKKVIEGLIPRSLPMRLIPQTESYLYAYLSRIPIHKTECPYAVNAHRGIYRDIILMAEENTPGTRHSILNASEEIIDALILSGEINKTSKNISFCNTCGEPTSSNVCKTCKIMGEFL